MPRHLISDAHEWKNEIPTVPTRHLAKPQPRERALKNQRGKKTLLSFDSSLVLWGDIEVPEITTDCWGILNKSPNDIMCSSSRMVVKRKGADKPAVLACTLLAYAPEFELGETLAEAERDVALNHPHCAKFCVLGGASCSA